MACNCPIVSTDVGDVSWVIGSTQGCYISANDPIDLMEKIILAIKYSKTNPKTNGRDYLIELGLDENTIAKKIISVYQDLLEHNN